MYYQIAICDDSKIDTQYITNFVKCWAQEANISVHIDAFPSAEVFLFHYEEKKDWSEKKNDEPKEKYDVTDLIKNQYGSDVYELVQLYSKLNEAGKNKIMEELRDTAALPKYTEPVKRDAQKMA